jgi:hypothetical protein
MAGRARPTLRCLREDLALAVPRADTPLEDVSHPLLAKATERFADDQTPHERDGLDNSIPSITAHPSWLGRHFPTRGESIWIEFRQRSFHERSPSHQGSSARRAPRGAVRLLHPSMMLPGG